jgi:hypothetical protein
MSKLNPKLQKDDRIVLVHMDGESIGAGIKGKVLGITNTPNMSSKDLGYQYDVQWFDDEGKAFSKLSLLPEVDAWILDKDHYESKSLNEIQFKNIDELINWGDFLSTFGKDDLNSICEFLELERRSGFFNMATDGGRFLLSGRDYIESFIKLKSFENNFDEKDKNIHKLLLSRAQEVRDIFIRGAMKYLDEKDQESDIPNIQKIMQKLARTSKEWWMRNADKYLNKEIE